MIRATAFRQPTRQPLFASASSAQLASFSTDTGTQQRARTDSIMFVPAAVGLIDEGGPLSRYGVGILAATAISTLLTMVVTALVFRWAVKRFGSPEPQPEAVEEAAS